MRSDTLRQLAPSSDAVYNMLACARSKRVRSEWCCLALETPRVLCDQRKRSGPLTQDWACKTFAVGAAVLLPLSSILIKGWASAKCCATSAVTSSNRGIGLPPRVEFGKLLEGMVAHQALAVGGSLHRIVMDDHKLGGVFDIAHRMYVELDGPTTQV